MKKRTQLLIGLLVLVFWIVVVARCRASAVVGGGVSGAGIINTSTNGFGLKSSDSSVTVTPVAGGTDDLSVATFVAGATNNPVMTDYYIAPPPMGSPTNNGSKSSPWAALTNFFQNVSSNGYCHIYSGVYDNQTNQNQVGVNMVVEGYGPTRPVIYQGASTATENSMFLGGTNLTVRYIQIAETNTAWPLVENVAAIVQGTLLFEDCVVQDAGDAIICTATKMQTRNMLKNTSWTIMWDGFQENGTASNLWTFENSSITMSNSGINGEMFLCNSAAFVFVKSVNTSWFYTAPGPGLNGVVTNQAQFFQMGGISLSHATNYLELDNSPLINTTGSTNIVAIALSGTGALTYRGNVAVLNNSPEIPNLVNTTSANGCSITTNANLYATTQQVAAVTLSPTGAATLNGGTTNVTLTAGTTVIVGATASGGTTNTSQSGSLIWTNVVLTSDAEGNGTLYFSGGYMATNVQAITTDPDDVFVTQRVTNEVQVTYYTIGLSNSKDALSTLTNRCALHQ
jgi:hypothetical protein